MAAQHWRDWITHRHLHIPVIRLAAMASGWVAYALLFLFLYPRIGPAAGSLGMLPVLITAWLYGRWAGLLAGLLLLAFTPSMGILSGDTDPIRLLNQSLPGYAMAVLTGFAFGWVRDTSNELRNQVAERKRVEDALQRSLAQLEERNKELDAFAHTVAHDLKTSLTDIFVYADLLLEDHARMSAEDVRDVLGDHRKQLAEDGPRGGRIAAPGPDAPDRRANRASGHGRSGVRSPHPPATDHRGEARRDRSAHRPGPAQRATRPGWKRSGSTTSAMR